MTGYRFREAIVRVYGYIMYEGRKIQVWCKQSKDHSFRTLYLRLSEYNDDGVFLEDESRSLNDDNNRHFISRLLRNDKIVIKE
jgi:hypothetical protein